MLSKPPSFFAPASITLTPGSSAWAFSWVICGALLYRSRGHVRLTIWATFLVVFKIIGFPYRVEKWPSTWRGPARWRPG